VKRVTTFRGLHLEAYEHSVRTLLQLAVTDAHEMLALRNSRPALVMQSALEDMEPVRTIDASNHAVDGHMRAAIDLLEVALVLSRQITDSSILPKRRALRKVLEELAQTLQ
jgi:hypothetical protein